MEFATKTIHAGQPSEPETGSLIAPIFQTSTYEQDAPGVNRGFDYSRTNNPTRARLEAVLGGARKRGPLRDVRRPGWRPRTPCSRRISGPATRSSFRSTSTAARIASSTRSSSRSAA